MRLHSVTTQRAAMAEDFVAERAAKSSWQKEITDFLGLFQ